MPARQGRNRRYGYAHKQARKQWAFRVARGVVHCWRCGGWIPPGAAWDLGHMPRGGRHPEHRRCNRSDGGKQRAAQLYGKTDPGAPDRAWSRHWYGGFNPEACRECRQLAGPCEMADTEEAA